MKKQKYNLATKITAFLSLYVSGCVMLVTAYIVLAGPRIHEIVVKDWWPFRWFLYTSVYMLPLSVVVSILLFAFLLMSAGVRKDDEQVELHGADRIYADVLTVLCAVLLFFGILFLLQMPRQNVGSGVFTQYGINSSSSFVLWFGMLLFYIYTVFMFWCLSITKRLRTHTLLTNTVSYQLLRFLWELLRQLGAVYQTGIAVIIFGIINLLLIFRLHGGFFFIIFVTFNLSVFMFMLYLALQLSKIKQSTQEIAAGHLEVNMDSSQFILGFKDVVISLNTISAGLQKALDGKMRSERLKTELITNVSHDIKTPLTSIINYVDLLKKEEMNNEQAHQYLQVLEQKSHRLKDLIEDLMEASKASTGNIAVELTEIHVHELLKQITGEYDERLRESGLEVVQSLPQGRVIIQADRRHMSRLLENIFSNIKKYALPRTRVYLDLTTDQVSMSLTIKNISAEGLNISPEDLMARFVRGDTSRHTEGSGLGLSIAKSLTEIQGGTFAIQIVGDLFAVKLDFPLYATKES
ncbi:MAG: HAMP domain-containing histidine kinase [Firmicutes bacterium]|nr:HAMP domain-containing histidine kinase [Bacillota bacterium]